MVLEWSAEEVAEITMPAFEQELGAAATNLERRVPNLDAVCQQIHTPPVDLTNHEANDTVANSHKNSLSSTRRLVEGRVISLGRCANRELPAGIEKRVVLVSRHEKKLKKELDDEIEPAGLWGFCAGRT